MNMEQPRKRPPSRISRDWSQKAPVIFIDKTPDTHLRPPQEHEAAIIAHQKRIDEHRARRKKLYGLGDCDICEGPSEPLQESEFPRRPVVKPGVSREALESGSEIDDDLDHLQGPRSIRKKAKKLWAEK